MYHILTIDIEAQNKSNILNKLCKMSNGKFPFHIKLERFDKLCFA